MKTSHIGGREGKLQEYPNCHPYWPGTIEMSGVAKFYYTPLQVSARGFRSSSKRFADVSTAEVKGIPHSKLNKGVPTETWTNERRVACTPAVTALLTK